MTLLRIQSVKDKLALLVAKRWMEYVWIVLIMLLAASLRFYKLGAWSFWIDEIFTVNHALRHYGNLQLLLENIPPAGNWIPTSVILTAQILNIFGISEWSARLGPAILGVVSIPILYFPFKKLFSAQVALIAMLLLAMNTWHIEWSQTARFYTSLMLFYTLALVCFFYGIERDRPFYILAFMFLLYMTASERLFGVFIVPVVLSYFLFIKILPFEKPPGLRFRNLLLLLLPVLTAGIVEGLSLLMYGTSRFFADFSWFAQFTIEDPFRLLSFISFDIGVPLVCFALLSGVYLLVNKSRAGLLMFVSAIVPVVLLMALNLIFFTKSRYVFFTLPSWIALGAFGIWEVLRRTKGQVRFLTLGLLLMLFADAGGSNLLYYQINQGNRHNWKGAFSLIYERTQSDDEVVTSWPQWKGFYWHRDIIIWEELEPETVINSGKRFWFILDEETVWGNPKMKKWLDSNAELVDVLYLRRENDYYLRIYLYDPTPKLQATVTEPAASMRQMSVPVMNWIDHWQNGFTNDDSRLATANSQEFTQ
jgi:hypothetical protein